MRKPHAAPDRLPLPTRQSAARGAKTRHLPRPERVLPASGARTRLQGKIPAAPAWMNNLPALSASATAHGRHCCNTGVWWQNPPLSCKIYSCCSLHRKVVKMPSKSPKKTKNPMKSSGGAVFKGFTVEAVGAAEGFEVFGFLFCFGGAGASLESASSAD